VTANTARQPPDTLSRHLRSVHGLHRNCKTHQRIPHNPPAHSSQGTRGLPADSTFARQPGGTATQVHGRVSKTFTAAPPARRFARSESICTSPPRRYGRDYHPRTRRNGCHTLAPSVNLIIRPDVIEVQTGHIDVTTSNKSLRPRGQDASRRHHPRIQSSASGSPHDLGWNRHAPRCVSPLFEDIDDLLIAPLGTPTCLPVARCNHQPVDKAGCNLATTNTTRRSSPAAICLRAPRHRFRPASPPIERPDARLREAYLARQVNGSCRASRLSEGWAAKNCSDGLPYARASAELVIAVCCMGNDLEESSP